MKTRKHFIFSLFLLTALSAVMVGCQKDSYYIDTGLHNPKYNGNVLQYLQNNSNHMFDSLCKVIRLAGMEDIFKNDSITFFAPADTCIMTSVMALNVSLIQRGKDTISDLAQIDSSWWRYELSLYLYKGIHRLKDYPQVDPSALQVFGGQYYSCYGDVKSLNIGVWFHDENGVQYAGYRQLMLGYFSGDIPPSTGPIYDAVASSDINPTNGIVHVLQYNQLIFSGATFQNAVPFGFKTLDFINGAVAAGIDYTK